MDIVMELKNKISRDNRCLLDRAAEEIERLRAENENLKSANEQPKEISVQVTLGALKAEIGGDPDYPEIFVYLERKDGVQIDLVAVGQDGPDEEDLKGYIYRDTSTESYTESYTWDREALEIEAE